ncbi:MAG: hypothetical protein ACI9OH_003684, partial [Oleispira sp.]
MLIKIPTRLLLPLAISLAGISVSSVQADEFDGASIELDEQVVSGRLYANPVSAAAFNVTVLEQAD